MAQASSAPAAPPSPTAAATPVSASGNTAADTPPENVLATVVVTAQRRETDLQKTPVAVAVVSAAQMARAGNGSVRDLVSQVPSLQYSANVGYNQIYLRGVGSSSTSSYFDPAVALNVDGVTISRPSVMNTFFFDMDRVEVLKGPQGTLYGRNATGGAINVITKKPTDQFGGYFSASVGNFGLLKGEGAVNLPVNSQLAIRAAFQSVNDNGYMTQGYDDQKTTAGRINVLYKPTDDISLLLSADYMHLGGKGTSGTYYPYLDSKNPWISITDPRATAYRTSFRNGAAYTIGGQNGVPIGAGAVNVPPGVFSYTGNGLPPVPDIGMNDTTNSGVSADLEWKLPFATLSVVAAHRDPRVNMVTLPAFPVYVKENSDENTGEIRLTSNDGGPLKWLVGGYIFGEDVHVNQLNTQFTGWSAPIIGLGTKSWAVFTDNTYKLTDRLSIFGGLRYTEDTKTLNMIAALNPTNASTCATAGMVYSPPAFPLSNVPVAYPECSSPNTGTIKSHDLSYRAGLEFDVTPTSSIYGSASSAYKSGGFSTAYPPNNVPNPGPGLPGNAFKPEKLYAYVIGSKNRFFDNRLQLNVEVFNYMYNNHQEVLQINLNNVVYNVTTNIPHENMTGVDVEANWIATINDRFSAKLSYEHSEYQSFTQYFARGTGPSQGAALTGCQDVGIAVGASEAYNCSGKRGLRIPEWSATLGYDHTFDLPDGARLIPRVETHIESATWLDLNFNSVNGEQPAYTKTNLTLSYEPAHGSWNVDAWVRNIENTPVAGSSFLIAGVYNRLASGNVPVNHVTLQAPRTFGVTVSARF